jgi:hypothetical protein
MNHALQFRSSAVRSTGDVPGVVQADRQIPQLGQSNSIRVIRIPSGKGSRATPPGRGEPLGWRLGRLKRDPAQAASNTDPREGSVPQPVWNRASTIGRVAEFVPPDFDVPLGLRTSEFVLEPLGPEHNEQDYDAWTSSMEHIAATPGYPDGAWPREMTRDENRADLQRHADDFRTRKGFTYTVLDPAGRDVIGCVYIYPLPDSEFDACALLGAGEPRAPGYPGLARRE